MDVISSSLSVDRPLTKLSSLWKWGTVNPAVTDRRSAANAFRVEHADCIHKKAGREGNSMGDLRMWRRLCHSIPVLTPPRGKCQLNEASTGYIKRCHSFMTLQGICLSTKFQQPSKELPSHLKVETPRLHPRRRVVHRVRPSASVCRRMECVEILRDHYRRHVHMTSENFPSFRTPSFPCPHCSIACNIQ